MSIADVIFRLMDASFIKLWHYNGYWSLDYCQLNDSIDCRLTGIIYKIFQGEVQVEKHSVIVKEEGSVDV